MILPTVLAEYHRGDLLPAPIQTLTTPILVQPDVIFIHISPQKTVLGLADDSSVTLTGSSSLRRSTCHVPVPPIDVDDPEIHISDDVDDSVVGSHPLWSPSDRGPIVPHCRYCIMGPLPMVPRELLQCPGDHGLPPGDLDSFHLQLAELEHNQLVPEFITS